MINQNQCLICGEHHNDECRREAIETVLTENEILALLKKHNGLDYEMIADDLALEYTSVVGALANMEAKGQAEKRVYHGTVRWFAKNDKVGA